MTATMHIGRRTTPHRPRLTWRARWDAFALRHFRRVQAAEFRRLHDALPLAAPERHDMDAPALEAAFMRLAVDHPAAVTPSDGGPAARDADRETGLLAACDVWFRDIHGPQHRWQPGTVAAYHRLMDDVRHAFHPGGDR
ncbi:hypothetical protein RI578_06740 [Streptomyces sp. BB1-1-1]|uniref:hypothetical protein n=1 Tax=Streptomyces sp. BB1-1-1 TaxID=3074430 RepID=UPI002877864E|nr:hypothetical protein [Streptomyces sp. BB1-1-1]WND34010.1 hypothetical protein RI578_06740 [Streptomyces sp. BB1-1-1]